METLRWHAMIRDEIGPTFPIYSNSTKIILFDVGFHKGEWSMAALRAGRDNVEIHAFEPNAALANLFDENSAGFLGSERECISMNRAALGRVSGVSTYHTSNDNRYESSMFERSDVDLPVKQKVDVVTLDEYVARHEIRQIDLLKLDVEGAEFDALVGAQGSLKSGAIRSIIFEFTELNVDLRIFFKDFWKLLSDNFCLFHLHPETGKLIPIVEYSGRWEILWGTTYFFAKRKARPAGRFVEVSLVSGNGEGGHHTWMTRLSGTCTQAVIPLGHQWWRGTPKHDGDEWWGLAGSQDVVGMHMPETCTHSFRLNTFIPGTQVAIETHGDRSVVTIAEATAPVMVYIHPDGRIFL